MHLLSYKKSTLYPAIIRKTYCCSPQYPSDDLSFVLSLQGRLQHSGIYSLYADDLFRVVLLPLGETRLLHHYPPEGHLQSPSSLPRLHPLYPPPLQCLLFRFIFLLGLDGMHVDGRPIVHILHTISPQYRLVKYVLDVHCLVVGNRELDRQRRGMMMRLHLRCHVAPPSSVQFWDMCPFPPPQL